MDLDLYVEDTVSHYFSSIHYSDQVTVCVVSFMFVLVRLNLFLNTLLIALIFNFWGEEEDICFRPNHIFVFKFHDYLIFF